MKAILITQNIRRLATGLLSLKVKWLSVVMFGTLTMMGVHFHQIGKQLTSSFSLGGTPSQAAPSPTPPTPPSLSTSEATPQISPTEKILDQEATSHASPSATPPTPHATPTTAATDALKKPTPAKTENASHALVEKGGSLDLLNLTPEEFQVLQSLVSYQKGMRQEQSALAEKEKKLEILTHTLNQKVEQLQLLKAAVEKLITGQEQKSQQYLTDIVKIYESMKPQEAAQILAALDFNITIEIVSQMKGKKASEILASLPPEQAAQLTTALAQKSQEIAALAT